MGSAAAPGTAEDGPQGPLRRDRRLAPVTLPRKGEAAQGGAQRHCGSVASHGQRMTQVGLRTGGDSTRDGRSGGGKCV